MTHAQLVQRAVAWLRFYGCDVVLSEQACSNGEMPDAIGWKRACHSVLVECKVSRADFLADRCKPFRQRPELGVGAERFYIAPPSMIRVEELPRGWGLLEWRNRRVAMRHPAKREQRSDQGLRFEMNLLLASLRRVEIRIEPQTITEFLKWKNRMAEHNGGDLPKGLVPPAEEPNSYLQSASTTGPPHNPPLASRH